jgi:hypothetical protein
MDESFSILLSQFFFFSIPGQILQSQPRLQILQYMEPATKPLLKIWTDFFLLLCQMARIWQEKGEETAFSLPSATTPSPGYSWKIILYKGPYFVRKIFRFSSKLTKKFPIRPELTLYRPYIYIRHA